MARKTTPEKPPTKQEASLAGKALRTGKATPAQIRSMAGRIEFGARCGQASQEALTEPPCFRKQVLGGYFIPQPLGAPSQKSSIPQDANFLSQALMSDTRDRFA